MKNEYTAEDVCALQKILRLLGVPKEYQMPERYRNPELSINSLFFENSYPNLYIEGDTVSIEENPTWFLRHYLDTLGVEDKADVYGFVYYCPFESVPLHLDDKTLSPYVRWRLEIGK
ncbi:MAG: hypothetical protein GF334_02090 [Candidatus Altiarchaeales archaeon]|nr:hypothetical protein [Candidatus Altiarchaeales archaeon]